jgi:hypothetical protein
MFVSGFTPGEDLGGLRRYARAVGGNLERYDMDIRKIAAVGGFAIGTALAFAPLASADTPITSTLDSEIASLNSLFQFDATYASVPSADVTLGGTGVYDTVLAADAPKVTDPGELTILDYALYGVDPIKAGIGSDPGAYDVENGAMGEYDNAFNVELYALENGGALAPAADLLGTGDVSTALATNSVLGAVESFDNAGFADLLGYFDIPSLTSLF